MENENNIWYFTKEQLEDSPSRRSGIDACKELSYRQQAANFIQDMGQRLQVSQLCINTAIVYMHRFYVFHSFVKIHRNNVAICALFLAAKVEEQPRKLEHVIKVSHMCLHRDEPPLDVRSELYLEKQAELVQYENIMLQTLGFNIGIEHPHTYVVKLCQLVKASKDLAQTSYFMATNSLHLTTMCLQHKPTIVASVCIHLACKWSNWKIEKCKEGKEWFYYVDKSVTLELLEDLTKEFIQIMENCPNRLKRRVVTSNGKDSQYSERCRPEQASGRAEKEKAFEIKQLVPKKGNSPLPSSSFIKEENEIPSSSGSAILESTSVSCSPAKKIKIESSSSAPISLAAYREKREKERQEQKIVPSELPTSSQNHCIDGRHPKHMINHEKIRPFVPHIKQADRMLGNVKPLEKSNKEIISAISDVEPTGFGKFNHQSPRLPIDSHHLKDNKHIIKGLIKNVSEDIKSNCETPTVLKRVNCAEVADQPDSTENFLDANTQGFRIRHEEELKMRTKPHAAIEHKVPESERTARKIPETVVPNKVPKIKQHKNITISSSNSHEKLLPMPQVNTLKHSPNVDSAKANGSKIIELLPDHQPPPFFEAISSRPSVPSSNKPERKERHKHKHYLPNKEKTSNHRIVEASSEQNHPVGLKITIPKDKIVLSGIHQELSHKSNSVKSEDQGKKSLKIKIPKPKVVCDETKVGVKASPAGSSIKLVFTKNKNADSYSTTQIQDKSSRKRDRSSPKTSESNSRNSHPASKPPKSARLDQTRGKSHYHQDNISVPIPSEQKFSHHPHHVEIEQQNYSTNKQVNSQWVYHPMNDGSHLPQCVMPPFGTQQCPPSYFPHPQPLLINANMFQNQIMPHLSFGHLQPPPPPPPSAGPPPLPRDPPPPLPPQPPPPIE